MGERLTPKKNPISLKIEVNENKQKIGFFEMDGPAYIDHIIEEGAKTVLSQELDAVRFVFNDKPIEITHEEALKIYSPDNLRTEINEYEAKILSCLNRIEVHKAEIQSYLSDIEILKGAVRSDQNLGLKVYGENFTKPEENK